MRRVALALALLSCQALQTDDTDDSGSAGGGGGLAGGSSGGATAGGSSGGAAAGGAGGFGGGAAAGGAGTSGGGASGGSSAGGGVDPCPAPTGGAPSCDAGWCTVPRAPGAGNLVSVSGAAQNDLWVAEASGLLLRWSGAQWACVAAVGLARARDVWASADEAWIVGEPSNSSVLRYTWRDGRLATMEAGGSAVNTVWGSGGRIFIGTEGGELRAYAPDAGWQRESAPGVAIRDLQGSFAAAAQGRVLVRDAGGGWAQESAGSSDLAAVAASPTHTSAVEVGGGAFVRQGVGSWAAESGVPGAARVHALGSGGGELYATGEADGGGGFFARRDPTLGWQLLKRHPVVFNDVWVAADQSAWLVGSSGTLLGYTPPRCGYPTSPIADDFDGEGLGPKWNVTGAGATAVVRGGGLEVTPGTGANGSGAVETTLASPGMVGRCVSVEVERVARTSDGGDTGAGTFLVLSDSPPSAGATLKLELSAGRMKSYFGDPAVPQDSMEQPTDGGLRFVRICEASGAVTFDYGPDGRDWRPFSSYPGGQAWLSTIERVRLSVFNVGGTVSAARFDNLNRCP